jgi:hypothetical protein
LNIGRQSVTVECNQTAAQCAFKNLFKTIGRFFTGASIHDQKIVTPHAILYFVNGLLFSELSLKAGLRNHTKSTSLVGNYDRCIHEIAFAQHFGSCRFDRFDYYLVYIDSLESEERLR